MISRSVPHTPSAIVRASTAPSESGGSRMSSSRAELATPGQTVIARIASPLNYTEASPPWTTLYALRRQKVPDGHENRGAELTRGCANGDPHADLRRRFGGSRQSRLSQSACRMVGRGAGLDD